MTNAADIKAEAAQRWRDLALDALGRSLLAKDKGSLGEAEAWLKCYDCARQVVKLIEVEPGVFAAEGAQDA